MEARVAALAHDKGKGGPPVLAVADLHDQHGIFGGGMGRPRGAGGRHEDSGDKVRGNLVDVWSLEWPLTGRQPSRDELVHSVKARDVYDVAWALQDELRGLVRVEPEYSYDQARKQRLFTLIYRLRAAGDGGNAHFDNRAKGGGRVQGVPKPVLRREHQAC